MPRSQVCDRDTEITFIHSIVKDFETEQFWVVGRKKVLQLASVPGCRVLEGPRSSNATTAEDLKVFAAQPGFGRLLCPCNFSTACEWQILGK